jgi:hypothetical protein
LRPFEVEGDHRLVSGRRILNPRVGCVHLALGLRRIFVEFVRLSMVEEVSYETEANIFELTPIWLSYYKPTLSSGR